MVKIVREAQPDGSVKWSTGLQPLADIANVEHFIPRDWISEDGYLPNEKFVAYAQPLIEGEVKAPGRKRPAQVRCAREEQGGEEAPAARRLKHVAFRVLTFRTSRRKGPPFPPACTTPICSRPSTPFPTRSS